MHHIGGSSYETHQLGVLRFVASVVLQCILQKREIAYKVPVCCICAYLLKCIWMKKEGDSVKFSFLPFCFVVCPSPFLCYIYILYYNRPLFKLML